MQYENAKDILPTHLLEELQKYAAGRLLYIPAMQHKNWGENSGMREKMMKRNIMIQNKYAHGVTITELADEYYLSIDSIKKIIYSVHKNQELLYSNTISSAISYADAGILEEWIHSYTLFTKKGEDIMYREEQISLVGVVKLPLRLVNTSKNVELKINKSWNQNELGIEDLPPLVIIYKNHKLWCQFEQEDYFLDVKQSGRNTYPAIIVIPEKEDFIEFNNKLGNLLYFMYSDDIRKK